MNELQEKILKQKNEKNALILAHYYQTSEIREIADVVGDSYEMARRARNADQNLLIVCGVLFMAESAKILSPDKTVLFPTLNAGCPMADMITADGVHKLRNAHPEAAVMCYVNSSAAVKAVSDVCCTSSSAVAIARALPEKQIIFIPDRNLGAYVASQIQEKEIILYDGCCPIHDRHTESDLLNVKNRHCKAMVLAHPECRPEVLRHADYIGSTSGIINTALKSGEKEFIIATESEISSLLQKSAPEKAFYPLTNDFICPDMKKTRLSDVLMSLENGTHIISLSDEEANLARKSLELMVELGG